MHTQLTQRSSALSSVRMKSASKPNRNKAWDSNKQKSTSKQLMPHSATMSSQATYLSATVNGVDIADNLQSSAAGHSEDRFIDEVLPASVAHLSTVHDNTIYIGINRSPCTSTDHVGNGQPSSGKGKGMGVLGCSERLINLVNHGFTHSGVTYPIRLDLSVRGVYGSNSDQEANSVRAMEAMVQTGRITIDTQQLGGSSERFMGTSTAKKL